MKPYLYIAMIALMANACSVSRSITMEDDIYYVPGKKALAAKEAGNLNGAQVTTQGTTESHSANASRPAENNVPSSAFTPRKQQVINPNGGQLETVDMTTLAAQAEERLAYQDEVNETLYENTGYWMGGYKGNGSDLPEIQRIINLYPQGFAYFNSNGLDIAMNLSFDSDWNVYTDNGRYWWFPSNSNIQLYSSLLFGTYPKYIWTVIWDTPRFDSWSFNRHFNYGIRFGWSGPGWHAGIGWNTWHSPWHYDPWCDPWYNPWHNPWHGGWYNPWYGRPGWHHPSHWNKPPGSIYPGGGNNHIVHPNRPGTAVRPNSPVRPSIGGNSIGVRPGTSVRPGVSGTRPNTGTRPGNNSTVRPGTSTQPNTTTQPGTTTRPASGTRPGAASRPGATTRPGTTTTQPGTTTRPGSVTRPGTITRPGTVTAPEATNNNRPVKIVAPSTGTTRPGSATRPGSTTRTAPTASKASDKTDTRTTNKTYSRPQNNYRPTYNTNSPARHNFNFGTGSSSDSHISSFPSRNTGNSHSAPVRNSNGGSRRR